MKGILFRPEIWQAKQKVLETYGMAVTRRLDGLKEINKEPDMWKPSYTYNDIPQPDDNGYWFSNETTGNTCFIKPRYQVGDIVYIKEAYWQDSEGDIYYKADWIDRNGIVIQPRNGRWRSPMFLPERFARYFIKILDVRPERLNDITEADAIAEGMTGELYHKTTDSFLTCARDVFQWYWDSINLKHPWAKNEWVWAYQFEEISEILGKQC